MRPILSLATTLLAVLACACCSGNGNTSTSSSGGGTTGKATTGGKTSSGSNGGTSSGGTGTPSGSIGDSCGTVVHCISPLSCLSQIPQGYCTETCNPATAGSCPSNGTCVEATNQFLCGLSCATNMDCTRGGYACDPTCLVCVPSELVGQLTCGTNFAGCGGNLDGGACGSLPATVGTLTWNASVNSSASAATLTEFEGSGAATDAGIVVVGYMETDDAGDTNLIGVSTSLDDGQSFTVGAPLVGSAVGSEADQLTYDPSVAVDPFGKFYFSWGGAFTTSTGAGQGHVWVTTSYYPQDGGIGWLTPQPILGPGDIPTAANGGGGVDKPAIGINPDGFLPYVVMGSFSDSYGGLGPYEILLIVGEQGGQTWEPSVEVDDSSATQRNAFRDLPSIAFDNSGNAYVAWTETTDVQQIAEDQVTGTAITGTTAASVWFSVVQPPLGGQVLPGEPNVQVSLDTDIVVLDVPKIVAAPDATELYVAYTVGLLNNTNIEVASSSSSAGILGNSWSHVNISGSDCQINFHPAAFLDSQNNYWVTWISNVDGNGSVLYSVSTDQGNTFSAPAVVSDIPFAFNTQLAIPATLGGYQSLFGAGGQLFSLWTGAPSTGCNPAPSSHVFLQESPLP